MGVDVRQAAFLRLGESWDDRAVLSVGALNAAARRQVLSPDRGLVARMAAVLLLGVAFDAALIVAAVLFVRIGGPDGGWSIVPVFIVVVAGLLVAAHARAVRRLKVRKPDMARRCTHVVEPLCLLADLPVPEVVVLWLPAQRSWTYVVPFRRARIYVSAPLVEKASDRELAAVLAHELTHIAHRDAWVMTFVAGPATMIILATQAMWRRAGGRFWFLPVMWLPLLLVAPIPLAVARLLSRQRELAADRGAAILTGSPSSVAEALMRLSGENRSIPRRDLRAMGTNDLFHFLPAREYDGRDLRQLWATHPPLRNRLERMAALESELHQARPASNV